MSFAATKFGAAQTHAHGGGGGGGGALSYHRPISANNRAPQQQQQQQQQQQSHAQGGVQWYGGGGGGGILNGQGHTQAAGSSSFAPGQRQALSSSQPLQIKHMRGSSAGSSHLARDVREVFAPVHTAPSARGNGNLSRTQPLQQAFGGLSVNGTATQQAPFPAQQQQQQQSQWQHFRGPVTAMPRNGMSGSGLSGGNTPVRAMGVRPQSSFPSNQRTPTPMQQQYNIISHAGEGSRGAWERDEAQSKARHPVVVEHPMGTRVYQPMHSPDSGEHSQPMAASGRSVGRQGSSSQRSQSVDRNQRSGLRAASASAHQQQMHTPLYSISNGHIQYEQQPAPFNRTQPMQLQQPYSNGHALSHTSPAAFSPASPYDSQRFSPASPGGGGGGGGGGLTHASSVRFSANAANWSPASPSASNGFSGSLGATTRAPLSLTSPGAGATASSRPSSAGGTSESDDGAGFLEVGMAEDPNPRFRPTMEDSHIIKYGDNWVDEDAANTARGGGKATARPRASSLDWGSPARKPAGHSSVAHKGGPHKGIKSGYFAVYDGHGGREAVDYIERNLHRSLASKLKAGAHPTQALESAFLETDQAMQQTRMYQDSGSTVAAALLRPSTSRAGQRDLFAANAGDARTVVAVHNGLSLQAVRLSRDHTPHDPAEAERVRRAGGTVFRGRVDGQLAVSRAIGDHSLKRSGVSAQPHHAHLPLTQDHKFVIVACDGLWDVMTDAEAVSLVAGMTDANKMADKLVKTAMARGTTDNVSAMVVRLQK